MKLDKLLILKLILNSTKYIILIQGYKIPYIIIYQEICEISENSRVLKLYLSSDDCLSKPAWPGQGCRPFHPDIPAP